MLELHLDLGACTFVLGTVVGSFLNVCIYRIPWQKSVIWPGSRCPKCLGAIAARDNVPILGWIALRGRCRACGAAISVRYPLIELLVGLLFLAAYLADSEGAPADAVFNAACAHAVAAGQFPSAEEKDGAARTAEAPRAFDHETQAKKKLVPQGILDVTTGLLTIFIGTSHETSDFIVDCLEQWWEANQAQHPGARRLVINLDNGPEHSGTRTQFLSRLVKFSDATGLEIKLVYYPPYHSKYNLIERCWGILENHWNGTLLNSVETVVGWARTMTWKGAYPVVHLVEKTYDKGVRIAKAAFKAIERRLQRAKDLPKYDILIQPRPI